jgi:signal recognition particle receptor subunit beta
VVLLGGQDKLRPMWRHYYADTKGLIFVVDSADVDRIDTGPDNARNELLKMLEEDALDGVPLLILANKQDIQGALSADELKSRLGVSMMANRKVGVFATIASQEEHDGLEKGLDWLADVLTGNLEKKQAEEAKTS